MKHYNMYKLLICPDISYASVRDALSTVGPKPTIKNGLPAKVLVAGALSEKPDE